MPDTVVSDPGPLNRDRLVEILRVMGHPVRFVILEHLAVGEQGVGDLGDLTGQSQTVISQQLALLRKAGLVRARRNAKYVFYSLAHDRLSAIAQALHMLATANASEEPDRKTEAAAMTQVTAAMFAQVERRG